MSFARWIVTACAILVLCAPLTLALAALSGVGHRWVDILAQFTAPALIATLILAAGLAAGRLWIASGAGAVVTLTLLIAVWPQWFPQMGEARPGAPVVSLYSANLFRENVDAKAIGASVAAADADVVLLIEAALPSAELQRVLKDYPHILAQPGFDRKSDNRRVIASRFPLIQGPRVPRDLPGQTAVVQTPFGPLTLVSAHLTRPWPYQYQWGQIIQTMELDSLMTGVSGPAIVAGDFNSVSSARIGRQVQNNIGLRPAPGLPGTWPSRLPALFGITIDQVYRTPDLAFVDRRVGRRNGSDHRPVVTRFTLAEPVPPRP